MKDKIFVGAANTNSYRRFLYDISKSLEEAETNARYAIVNTF